MKTKLVKNIACLLLLTGLLASCQPKLNSQIIKLGDDYDYSIVRGPLKSLEINTYKPDTMNGGIKQGELVNTSSFTLMGGGGKLIFNKEGRCISSMNYEKGSTDPTHYNEYEYSEGNLTKSITYKTPLKKVLVDKVEWEYDDKNRKVTTRFFESSYCVDNELWLSGKHVFEYNNYDDIIKQIDTTFVHHDCDDIRIRARVGNKNPKYANGLKVEDDTYRYEYDKDGNLVKKIEKQTPVIFNEYYANGVIKMRHLDVDSYDAYDEDGYLIKSTHPVRGGFMYTLEYSNKDKYGNWTRMVIYEDGRPYLIGERTITYYE